MKNCYLGIVIEGYCFLKAIISKQILCELNNNEWWIFPNFIIIITEKLCITIKIYKVLVN